MGDEGSGSHLLIHDLRTATSISPAPRQKDPSYDGHPPHVGGPLEAEENEGGNHRPHHSGVGSSHLDQTPTSSRTVT